MNTNNRKPTYLVFVLAISVGLEVFFGVHRLCVINTPMEAAGAFGFAAMLFCLLVS